MSASTNALAEFREVLLSIARSAAAATASEELSSACLECGGTGLRDSGGFQPWGEPIYVACDCDDTVVPMFGKTTAELLKQADDLGMDLS